MGYLLHVCEYAEILANARTRQQATVKNDVAHAPCLRRAIWLLFQTPEPCSQPELALSQHDVASDTLALALKHAQMITDKTARACWNFLTAAVHCKICQCQVACI